MIIVNIVEFKVFYAIIVIVIHFDFLEYLEIDLSFSKHFFFLFYIIIKQIYFRKNNENIYIHTFNYVKTICYIKKMTFKLLRHIIYK